MCTYAKLGLLLALALVVVLPGPAGASGPKIGYPNSMAALGDSITRAMDADPHVLGDQPQYSWSTGDNTTIASQYYRILLNNDPIGGHNYNDAVSGAKMVDLNGQAQTAVSQGAEYLTILMGANDVCTDTEGHMTSVSTFTQEFNDAMVTLTSGLPYAHIFVASIPNVYHLWEILKDNETARAAWGTFKICQSLLVNPLSTDQTDVDRRAAVLQRNTDFNTALSQVCSSYPRCRFDDNAVFDSQFGADQVSTLDYFHPSVYGQQQLAYGTWAATWEFADPVSVPVGGIAELPDGSGSSAANHIALAGLAVALVALGAGGWYGRRRWLS